MDPESITAVNQREYDIERLFLALRTSRGVKQFSSYEEVLVPNRQALVKQYADA